MLLAKPTNVEGLNVVKSGVGTEDSILPGVSKILSFSVIYGATSNFLSAPVKVRNFVGDGLKKETIILEHPLAWVKSKVVMDRQFYLVLYMTI